MSTIRSEYEKIKRTITDAKSLPIMARASAVERILDSTVLLLGMIIRRIEYLADLMERLDQGTE